MLCEFSVLLLAVVDCFHNDDHVICMGTLQCIFLCGKRLDGMLKICGLSIFWELIV